MQPNQMCRKSDMLLSSHPRWWWTPRSCAWYTGVRDTHAQTSCPHQSCVCWASVAPQSLCFYTITGFYLRRLPPPCGAEKGFDDVRCVQSSVNGTGIPVGLGGHSPFPGVWDHLLHKWLSQSNVQTWMARFLQPHLSPLHACPALRLCTCPSWEACLQ